MSLTAKSYGPLARLIVIDLTRVLAGPFCTLTLADLGARVIKVEMPEVGDDSRRVAPFMEGNDGQRTSGYFFSVNRNKESIALDLKTEADRAVFDKLLASADIVVENFTPGTMQKLGYGWDELHARHPSLILASISGFGQTGPYRERPAYDMVVQAMGGIMSLTGEEGGPPTRTGSSIGDLSAGMFGVIGIQAAVIERVRTGLGKHVDIAMLDSQVAMLENAFIRYQLNGVVPGPIGSRHPSSTPFGLFKARDTYFVIAAGNDRMFTRLCDALDAPEGKTDPRFATSALRCENHVAVKAWLEQILATRAAADWLRDLTARDIPCGPVNDIAAIMRDPHVKARGILIEMPQPNGETIVTAGCPVRFADDEPTPVHPAPDLDQHRSALLKELGLAG